jgi:hypothetical protein
MNDDLRYSKPHHKIRLPGHCLNAKLGGVPAAPDKAEKRLLKIATS